jgi:hypothetical protein
MFSKIFVVCFFVGLTFSGCKALVDDTIVSIPKLDGTWESGEYTLIFRGNDWLELDNGKNHYKGTFTKSETLIYVTITHEWKGDDWDYTIVPISKLDETWESRDHIWLFNENGSLQMDNGINDYNETFTQTRPLFAVIRGEWKEGDWVEYTLSYPLSYILFENTLKIIHEADNYQEIYTKAK